MLSAQHIIEEALALPIEQRTLIIDSLLKSMNTVSPETERKWVEISKNRLDDLTSGRVKGIPGDEVFSKIWERFSE